MSNLITTSKRFLEWAQSLPDVVIPAGLESDMQEAIASSEAVEQMRAPDLAKRDRVGVTTNELGELVFIFGEDTPSG